MVTPSDIVELARKHTGAQLVCDVDEDILRASGMDGDDANEFLEDFAKQFSVDMTDFLWFFHFIADEPPNYRRVKPIGQDGRAIKFIPITPKLLAEAANEGRWMLEYPVHQVQTSYLPTILMFVVLAIFVLAVTLLLA